MYPPQGYEILESAGILAEDGQELSIVADTITGVGQGALHKGSWQKRAYMIGNQGKCLRSLVIPPKKKQHRGLT